MSKPKIHDLKLYILIFGALLLSAISITVALSLVHLSGHQKSNNAVEIVNCDSLGESYFIYFEDNLVKPKELDAKTCDLITFINLDKFRLIAFGKHNEHTSYNGIYEQPLKPGDSFSITLDKTGKFSYHDHYQEYVGGSFSVSE